MASHAVGNRSSLVVCFSTWITGKRVTSTLAHVNGNKYCFFSVLWPFEQWHIRKFTQMLGTNLESNVLGNCSNVHTTAVNGLESHLKYIHFMLLYFSLQNDLCLQIITLYRSIRWIFKLHRHWIHKVQWVSHVLLQNLEAVTNEGAVPGQRSIFHCICKCYVISVSSLPAGRVHEVASVAVYLVAPHSAVSSGDISCILESLC